MFTKGVDFVPTFIVSPINLYDYLTLPTFTAGEKPSNKSAFKVSPNIWENFMTSSKNFYSGHSERSNKLTRVKTATASPQVVNTGFLSSRFSNNKSKFLLPFRKFNCSKCIWVVGNVVSCFWNEIQNQSWENVKGQFDSWSVIRAMVPIAVS